MENSKTNLSDIKERGTNTRLHAIARHAFFLPKRSHLLSRRPSFENEIVK